ncbi:hypothetical protein RJ639_037639 [Escallonia herrerae]|uniref:Thiol-disulfide oxudoreductase DCC n=1 Tax=Escallonia herrerae TaxID=1293975 RepID=A0AA89BFH4_9ASTE|nr:hypothetical protein RJ639_037639 [Escallonia herrerae]
MALRAAAASIGRRQASNPSLLSIPIFLRTRYHGTSSQSLHRPVSYTHIKTGHSYSVRAVHGVATDPVAPKKVGEEEQSSQNWKIKMLYDGECPLCMREVNMLRERDKSYQAIKFVDISSDEYSPEENQGLDYKTVMGRIHAILSDGTVVTDVENILIAQKNVTTHRDLMQAFRRLYEAVGLGWVYAITKYEPMAAIADAVYGVWAKYRLEITGRPPLEEVLELRKNKGKTCDDSKACKT